MNIDNWNFLFKNSSNFITEICFSFFSLLCNQNIFYHICDHDAIQKQTKVHSISFENLRLNPWNIQTNSKEREPIRINLDFQIDKDEHQCEKIGQQISWKNENFQYQSEDIPNETQKTALKETIENVRNYFQSIHLADRINIPYNIIPSIPNYFNLSSPPKTCPILTFIFQYSSELTDKRLKH